MGDAQEAAGQDEPAGVNRLTGISNSYLSQIERGERHPGPKLLRRLAALYGVGFHDLLKKAGYLETEEPEADETTEVKRAYRYVMSDPKLRAGARGPLSLETERFIVELYEPYSGKRVLSR